MAKEKPRKVENWEVKHAIFLGGHEIVFAEDENNKEHPYFVGNCSYDNPFGVAEYTNCIGTSDYLEAIQQIQRAAMKGEFDILLVFMFDRLGRRDDETPFVVEWFVKTGIEVWSALEGQQRFDSHVDKLMNYIRYWQASGESLKTSMRVKTRLSQLTEDGLYTGGSIPFGYRLEKRGRFNKKSREVYDIAVDENEAEIIRLIFHKYVDEGYGSQRLCRYLHENGIKSRDGKSFPNTSLNRIIKNEIYTGIIKNGDSQSAYIEELRIIDMETYSKAQVIMQQRTQPHSAVPLNCKGKSLLVGNIYCSHCGNRLTLTTSGRQKRLPDGSIQKETRMRYQCHFNVRHPGECAGQSGYSVPKIDAAVDSLLRHMFTKIMAASESEILSGRHEKDIDLARSRFDLAKSHLLEKKKEFEDYKGETLKVIRGQSKMNVELLNTLVSEAETQITDAQATFDAAETELTALLQCSENLKREYDRLLSWADLYDKSTFDAKKMIVTQFIKAVRVGKDYDIEVDFDVSFDEFQSFCRKNAESGNAQAPELRTA